MENNRTEEYTRNSYMKSYMENRDKEVENVFEKFISTCILETNDVKNRAMTMNDLKDRRDKIQTLWNDSVGLIVHSSKDKLGEAKQKYDDTLDIILLTSMLYKKNGEDSHFSQEQMNCFIRVFNEKKAYELEKNTDKSKLERYNQRKFEILSKVQKKIVLDEQGIRIMNAEETKESQYKGPFSTRR